MHLDTLEDTRTFAQLLLAQIPPGSLTILSGPLGVGKTTLTGEIVSLTGSRALVSSPTYTLIHEYPSPSGLIVHADAYRLPDTNALITLGLEDYLSRARLVLVEWGEGLLESYPEAYQVLMKRRSDVGREAELISPERV